MFYTYILESESSHSYYIGSCENVNKRLGLHNQGAVISTKRYRPWELVYSEEFGDRNGARRRELEIKGLKKRSAIQRIISNP
ncbi:MAG: GIY-YIG nuclease family protein [Candidatus Wildermuthbacteria bacterium]|nr:GIY-YIG nuclease family protein [Candidatus Wildermuthbacteria bacterium]